MFLITEFDLRTAVRHNGNTARNKGNVVVETRHDCSMSDSPTHAHTAARTHIHTETSAAAVDLFCPVAASAWNRMMPGLRSSEQLNG